VTESVRLAMEAFGDVPDDAWDVPAGGLEWSCWETVEHMADDTFVYAAQLSPSAGGTTLKYPPMYSFARRPGGPDNTVHVERDQGTRGLLRVLDACGGLLAAVVATAPADRIAYHVYGASNPSGFAAMGVVETLVHTYDVALGLGLDFSAPEDLCRRGLDRLFPDVPRDFEAWPTLLWATGRATLPGQGRRTGWRWDGTPR
jgi:hypothetical protein